MSETLSVMRTNVSCMRSLLRNQEGGWLTPKEWERTEVAVKQLEKKIKIAEATRLIEGGS